MTWKSKKIATLEQVASGHFRFLREPELLARVNVAWITILRGEKEGTFPPRRKISKRTVAWVEPEIDEWCAQRAAEMGGEQQ